MLARSKNVALMLVVALGVGLSAGCIGGAATANATAPEGHDGKGIGAKIIAPKVAGGGAISTSRGKGAPSR